MNERDAQVGENRHGRLPWLHPDCLSEEQRGLYEAIVGGPRVTRGNRSAVCDEDGRLKGPFNALLFMPGVGMALQELGAQIRYGTVLTDRQREIATLLTAVHHRSENEKITHRRLASELGLSEEALRAVDQSQSHRTFSAEEDIVLRVGKSLLEEGDLSDELYFEITDSLGEQALCELVALIGYYSLLAMHLRVWRVPAR